MVNHFSDGDYIKGNVDTHGMIEQLEVKITELRQLAGARLADFR